MVKCPKAGETGIQKRSPVSITALDSMTVLKTYWLEPEPITTLLGESARSVA